LKAHLSDWPECFDLSQAVCSEKLQAALDEIEQIREREELTWPMAEALRMVCEQVKLVLTETEKGVRWLAPPPMWDLLFSLYKRRAATERSDLTQAEADAFVDEVAQHLKRDLTFGRAPGEDATLQVELARLIVELADC